MADERVQRRLAAILAADVAGYSRLMGGDEEGTLAGLKACREVIVLKSKDHRGRIFRRGRHDGIGKPGGTGRIDWQFFDDLNKADIPTALLDVRF